MAIDFDKLVLGPCMNTFAVPIYVQPIKSRPAIVQYEARGIWDVNYYELMTEDGAPLATKKYVLGVRISEFAVVPTAGDRIVVFTPPFYKGHLFTVDKPDPDGQGGISLTLKAREPDRFEGSIPLE